MKSITPENIILIGSGMLLVSIFAGKMSSRFGIPSLLLFLLIGMFMGTDGVGYHFENVGATQFVGMMALSVILFSGGMDTRISDVKPIVREGVVLATVGVVATAFLTGGFIYLIGGFFKFNLTFAESLLLASVMSSTDSASVFALLRSKGLALRENLRETLELESGSNDPMAYILTIVLIQFIQGEAAFASAACTFVIQMVFGIALGMMFGYLAVWFVNRASLDNVSLYSVLLVACVFFIFSTTDRLGGNGYLAVYISGLIYGNSRAIHLRNTKKFFSGFAWLWQIIIFLTLGLLVNPRELLPVSAFALLIGAFLIVLGRPISVLISLLPFGRYSRNGRLYISWVGLRGAVPIIFATYPLVAKVPNAELIFNSVFFITILSLVVQGMSLTKMASWLGVSEPENSMKSDLDFELPDEMKSVLSEIDVTADLLSNGGKLMSLGLPAKTLVIMVRRDKGYFIPNGMTELKAGDKLYVISDRDNELKQVCQNRNIPYYTIGE